MYFPQPKSHHIQVGDKVTVHQRVHHGPSRAFTATVVKAAKVWLTLEEDRPENAREFWRAMTWKLRRDTQDDGQKYNPVHFFRTAEQEAWHVQIQAASAVLKVQGIEIQRGSTVWRDADSFLRLAAILEQAVKPALPVRTPGATLPEQAAQRHWERVIELDHHANHAFGL